MTKLVEALCTVLAELHNTTPEEEYQELKKIRQWFDKQDSDDQLWFAILWFTLDQVRIIQQMTDLSLSIQRMTEAMVAVSKLDNSTEKDNHEESTSVSQHV